MSTSVHDAAVACSISYAQRRHNETGRRYIVSDAPRALLDCAHNRQVLRELGESLVFVSRKPKQAAHHA